METSSIFFLTEPQRLTYHMPCVDIPYFQNGVQGVAGSNPAVPILRDRTPTGCMATQTARRRTPTSGKATATSWRSIPTSLCRIPTSSCRIPTSLRATLPGEGAQFYSGVDSLQQGPSCFAGPSLTTASRPHPTRLGGHDAQRPRQATCHTGLPGSDGGSPGAVRELASH